MSLNSNGYPKSQCNRRSRPSSRIESCSSAKSRTSNSSDRFYNVVRKLYQKTQNKSVRSHSSPIRPITRRKSNMPYSKQDTFSRCGPSPRPKNCKCFITDLTKADSNKVTKAVNDCAPGIDQTPNPAPRKKNKNKELNIHKKRVVEHDYLKFSLRVMEDIIRNNLHTNRQMRSIFKTHLEANAGHLDKDKMIQQINYLQLELNIPNESDDESEIKDVIPPIKYDSLPTTKLSPDLKCECKVVRRLSFPCENSIAKNVNNAISSTPKDTNIFNIEQFLEDNNEIFVTVNSQDQPPNNAFSAQQQTLLTRLSDVFEKSESTSSGETIKGINLDNFNNDEISNEVNVMVLNEIENSNFEKSIGEDKSLAVLQNIENKIDSVKSSFSDTPKQILSSLLKELSCLNEDVIKENIDCDQKALVITKSEKMHLQPSNHLNDDYVLIQGPIFVPKVYLNSLTTEETINISIPELSSIDRHLLVTKNAGVNTDVEEESIKQESVSTQCVNLFVHTSDKCLNTSITGASDADLNAIKFVPSYNLLRSNAQGNILSTGSVKNVDLDFYDLTPERDDNDKSIKTNLLLGDEYDIQKRFNVSPQIISEFYPDETTQTKLSDWSLMSEEMTAPHKNDSCVNQRQISDLTLKVILPSHTITESNSNTIGKFLEENLSSKSDVIKETDKHVDQYTTRKSNLKHYLSSSAESLTNDDEDSDDKFRKRTSTKGVSILDGKSKTRMSKSENLNDNVNEMQVTEKENDSIKRESQNSLEDQQEQEEEDQQNRLNPSDIVTSLPELVPQASVLMTVKRVTRTWEKLRSRKSTDKVLDSPRTYSVVDEVFSNQYPLQSNVPVFNYEEPKDEKIVKEVESPKPVEKSASKETFCCGLKGKKSKIRELTTVQRSEQVIPMISGVMSVDTKVGEGNSSFFHKELATSTSSLQKAVRYKSQPVYIHADQEHDVDYFEVSEGDEDHNNQVKNKK